MMIMRPPQHGHGSEASAARSASASAGSLWRLGHGEQLAGAGDVVGAAAVGEQAIVADAVEAAGQHVDEEAADELVARQRHDLVPLAAFDAVVLPPEGDAVVVEGDQAAVGDGDAVGVAREIGEHRLGPGERALGSRRPTRSCAAAPDRPRRPVLGERRVIAEEVQAAGVVGRERASPGTVGGTAARARAPAGRSPAGRRSSAAPSSEMPPPGTIMWTCG